MLIFVPVVSLVLTGHSIRSESSILNGVGVEAAGITTQGHESSTTLTLWV